MQSTIKWIMADAVGETRSFDATAAEVPPLDLQRGEI